MSHYLLWALGTAGNIAFGYACLPTAYRTWRAGKSIGTPINLAWNILIACLLFYGYLIGAYGFDPFICACSGAEVAAYAVVIRYHYWPRDRFGLCRPSRCPKCDLHLDWEQWWECAGCGWTCV